LERVVKADNNVCPTACAEIVMHAMEIAMVLGITSRWLVRYDEK